jgi:hypothetical protein
MPKPASGWFKPHAGSDIRAPASPSQPLRIALFGCGVVGRGVYETVKPYPHRF